LFLAKQPFDKNEPLSKTEQAVFGLRYNKTEKRHSGICKKQSIKKIMLLAYHVQMAMKKIESC